jgi:NADH:ubiquinone oxidoreductase subunit 3 (subunit A)
MKIIKLLLLYILIGIEMIYLSAIDYIADNISILGFFGTFIIFLLVGYITGLLIKSIWNI